MVDDNDSSEVTSKNFMFFANCKKVVPLSRDWNDTWESGQWNETRVLDSNLTPEQRYKQEKSIIQ